MDTGNKERAIATEKCGKTYTEAFPCPEAKVPPNLDCSEKEKEQCDFREKVNFTMGSNIMSILISSAPQTYQAVIRSGRRRN